MNVVIFYLLSSNTILSAKKCIPKGTIAKCSEDIIWAKANDCIATVIKIEPIMVLLEPKVRRTLLSMTSSETGGKWNNGLINLNGYLR